MAVSAKSERISPVSYLARVFSLIEHGPLRFMILDCPSEGTISAVVKIFDKENVTDVARVCEPTYSTALLETAGIQVHDLPFKDGGVPSQQLLARFLAIVEHRFGPPPLRSGSPPLKPTSTDGKTPAIAVHCVAGLGRAPLLVAVALIEYGMSPLDAIEYIRARRRGAFNTAQVKFLDSYKPISRSRSSAGSRMLRAAAAAYSGSGGTQGRGISPDKIDMASVLRSTNHFERASNSDLKHRSSSVGAVVRESFHRVFAGFRRNSRSKSPALSAAPVSTPTSA